MVQLEPHFMEFTDELEELIKQESEKAECMSLLHQMSHIKYNKLSIVINVPVIVLSSLIGFLSNINMFDKQNILLGAVSLLISIIKTMDSYFDYTKKSESHRMVGLNYNKISKLIQIQLSLDREHRISPDDLMVVITNDLQNLRDSEPVIDRDIIKMFNDKYHEEPGAKPSITNGLTTIKIVKSKPKGDNPKVKITITEPKQNSRVSV